MRIVFFCVAAIAGCATALSTEDREAAASVVASKQEPRPGCKSLGAAEGKDDSWGDATYDLALDKLKLAAFDEGANYVVIDGVTRQANVLVLVSGRIYKCPRAAVRSARCNPPCDSGQQCGADRKCHDLD